MVSAIIPAYNEEATISDVVTSIVGHPLVGEVIVVDDGSTDRTALAAEIAGARVIRLKGNSGKANAMSAGVRTAKGSVILFFDADVLGYDHEKISRILKPVVEGKREMYVALRARKAFWLNRLMRVFPILGGERALTRSLWERVPQEYKRGFEIEIALNHAAKATPKGMGFEVIYGLTHFIKEKKYGIALGLWRRFLMSAQVVRISFVIYVVGPAKSGYVALRKLFGIV
jgi:polyprenyl-phospho-N-acetylgalactosaminyl synthase